MSQVKPVYAEVTEFGKIAKEVIKNATEIFPAVDEEDFVDKIKVVAITNKKRKEEKDYASVKGVPMPVKMFCSCSYVVEMYLDDWQALNDAQKEWLVFWILRRIPTDSDKEGKVLPIDYKDDSVVLRTVGPDWLSKEDLPSITKSKSNGGIDWNNFGKETAGFIKISANSTSSVEEENEEESLEEVEGYEEVE